MISRAEQRRMARAARARIPKLQRRAAATALVRQLTNFQRLRPGLRIAAYLPAGSELDSRPLIRTLLTKRCQVFLPRITSWRAKSMRFFAMESGLQRPNRLGLIEPKGQHYLYARWLNVVFMPLVAFDDNGNRLGSGAGFYDRALAFRRLRRHWRGPLLIGLAFSAQQVESITATAQDIPLDAVITERGWRFFPEQAQR